ncbi:MAG: hypothetical protein VX672_09160 [Planctomycetota bacterium]|nr:hypothetical protein [Planctomycetota bacterium]
MKAASFIDRRPPSRGEMNDDEQRDILDRTRRNPAYRDTPLGRSKDAATAASLLHRCSPRPVRIGNRSWLWRVLEIPEPRSLVRFLIIDGTRDPCE